uniref:G protein-coupled receptor n=1 Tax=Gongylonema pulchrum TaxID=637853 RepID=A0A183ECK6_9BILA
LYYSFGYVMLVCSLGLNALHMALQREKSMLKLCSEMLTKPQNLVLLFLHMALFGFSILTLTVNRLTLGSSTTLLSFSAILLVPVPSLFYVLTVGLTDPQHIHSVS